MPAPPGTLEKSETESQRDEPGLISADFWSDVFVDQSLPWRRFLQSGMYHFLALVAIWEGSQFAALQPQVLSKPEFTRADVVVYYTPSEYLPEIDTRQPTSAPHASADPEYSVQPIISVPPEADNRSQTIVTAPNVRLQHDVPLPNMVAWRNEQKLPIGPAPVVPASETSRLAPWMERSVIAPPPDMRADTQAKVLKAPESAVIAPPPVMDANSARRLGDLNVGRSTVIAPAPQLSLDEQHNLGNRTSLAGRSDAVIAPPPAVSAAGGSRPGRDMIALSLHPVVGAPAEPPAGNRRGNFAATPEGHRGASGASGTNAGNEKTSGNVSSKKNGNAAPSGLYVGKASNAPSSPVAGNPELSNSSAYTVHPNLIASAHPPRVSARTLQPESESQLSDVERAVFGNRKFYSLSLNMPNLNSAGGSWVIRFAALKSESSLEGSYAQKAASSDASSGDSAHDLSAPSATRKVDPAYPLELMRQNVGGTVILYGIIHTDGTVGSVRVLRSVDERLDRFAGEAIAKWQFEPATKNGAPVDVEATFWIPFRPAKIGSSF